jgi:hypothetical protein
VEVVTGMLAGFRQGLEVAGVGEDVHVRDRGAGLEDEVPDQRRTDEAGASGDEDADVRTGTHTPVLTADG